LRRWLDEDRVGLRLHRRITEAAQEWQRSDRDSDLLYRGARLVQAIEWRERNDPELNPLEREFLDESLSLQHRLERHEKERGERELAAALKLAETERLRAEVESKARRRQRSLIFALVGLLFLAGLIAGVAVWQGISARLAEQRTREVASLANLSLARYLKAAGNDAQALAHIDQALRLNQRNEEAAVLASAMLTQTRWPLLLTVPLRHEGPLRSGQFSPEGRRVLTASDDGTARLWDTATGNPIGEPMKHQKEVASAQFSPDGRLVVTA
jgi:tetratricopeptide (TPR) repeat protein